MTLREAMEVGGRVSVFLLKLPGKETVISIALDRRTAEFVAERVGLEIDERLVNVDPDCEEARADEPRRGSAERAWPPVLSGGPRSGAESK